MSPSDNSPVPIAIVGIAAELPSGQWSQENLDYSSFFQFLLESGEAYEKIPNERFNIDAIKGSGMGQVLTDTGSFLKNLKYFDYLEFGITSKDARSMSLSTRKLIELTFLSLVDSGIEYRSKNIGCYMSGVAWDMAAVSGHDDSEARGSFASGPCMVANRVSYHLDLRGPSIPIDTACSSTLYTTHLAVQALRNGECEAAVVGGCQVNHRFAEWLNYTQGGVLSPDGKCKPFDAGANGFGRGEGAVVIVLKPVEQALADGDKIYATILGTGVNSCGSLAPVNAPVAVAQQDAMARAFASARRHPSEVDFLELHATGTAQGDPTEANWVGQEFQREDELLIGSVKGNIGHLEITAFLASLCKVCSILNTGIIPPNVNLKTPNPAIRWEQYKFRVPFEPTKLPSRRPDGRSLVAMTSSGIGGANGHCVVESAPPSGSGRSSFWVDGKKAPSLIVAGGLSPRSTTAVAESIPSVLGVQDSQVLSRLFGRRSRSMTWRSFSVALNGQTSTFTDPALVPKVSRPIVFVFSGQGPQHLHMGRELFKTNAVFRKSVLEMDEVYTAVTGISIIKQTGLFDDVQSPVTVLGSIWPISITLPALTILQIALVECLIAAGVKPDALIGHSAGETAVLWASGAAPKEMAVELAIARGKAMALLEGEDGTMAALSCSPAVAAKIIADVKEELGEGALDIGCHNSADSVTLSGAASHVDRAVAKADAADIFARRLRTSTPVHSSMMELCRSEYESLVADVFARYKVSSPKVQTYSTRSGTALEGTFDPAYFWDGTRGPVLFTEATTALLSDLSNPIFCEIGPHPVLASYLSSLSDQKSTVLCTMKRARPGDATTDSQVFVDCLGRFVAAGYNGLDFDVLCGSAPGDDLQVPQFPFARKEVPFFAQTAEISRQLQRRNGPLDYPQLHVNAATHPVLADHVIKDEPIMPASGYIEMVLERGARKLWNVEFKSMLPLSGDRPTPVQLSTNGSFWTINSASSTDYSTWPIQYNRLHSKGFLATSLEEHDRKKFVPLEEIRGRLKPLDIKGLYDGFNFAQYGPLYQRIISCLTGVDPNDKDEVLVKVRGADYDLPDIADYRLHPAILDAALHILVHPLVAGSRDPAYYYLPARCESVIIHDALVNKPFPAIIYTHSTLRQWTPETIIHDVTIADEEGNALCTMEGLEVNRHGKPASNRVKQRFVVEYEQTPHSVAHVQSLTNGHAAPTPAQPAITVIRYARGDEMKIQKQVLGFNDLEERSLWFVAPAGTDGDALVGFTRALRREYRIWTVRSLAFEGSWTYNQMVKAAQYLSTEADVELELSVYADGSIHVPRIVAAPDPEPQLPFDPKKPWVFSRSLQQLSLPTVRDPEVAVHVSAVSRSDGRFWEFVGLVDGDATRPVAGIHLGALSNFAVVHKGSLAELPAIYAKDDKSGPPTLAMVIGVLAIGLHLFSHLEHLKNDVILVTHSDTPTGSQLIEFYERLGLQVASLPSDPSVSDIQRVASLGPKIAVSAYEALGDIQVLKTVIASDGKIFLWNHPETGVAWTLAHDPWLIGEALRLALNAKSLAVSSSFKHPVDLLDAPSLKRSAGELFSPDKQYLLVGGIGSLGLQICLWMYQRGARHIILTSRSGRGGIARRGDRFSQQLLEYLVTLQDLDVRTEAADATSTKDMGAIVSSVTRPWGGVMLLSAMLIDRSFAAQTQDTFEQCHTSKVGAFHTLEKVMPIEALDWLIAFSSISGMFGNAGQTNYASANTAITGLTREHKNAFTLVCPAILDVGFVLGATMDNSSSRVKHLASWGYTSRELNDLLEDSISMLQDGPFWIYVPDLKWDLVKANMGESTMYDHLVADEAEDGASGEGAPATLTEIISRVLDIAQEDISPDVPLTAYGLDSLSAASLSYALRPLIAISQLQLLADLSLRQIQERCDADKEVTTTTTTATPAPSNDVSVKTRLMVSLVEKYTASFVPRKAVAADAPSAGVSVLVTGVTGSLGAHALARLLQAPSVDRVYALVRKQPDGPDALARLHSAFVERGIDTSLLGLKRLSILQCSRVGELPEEVLEKLRSELTHIVHLAWHVDFGTPLAEFEPAIAGLRELADLALSSRRALLPKLVFASTLGVNREPRSPQPIAEVPITDPLVSVGSGYSESKWVAERVLTIIREKTALKPVIVRIGQLTGGLNGTWKSTEWVPAMISASVALGTLPDGPDAVSWLPVDIAAAAIVDMLDASAPFVHVRHPRPMPWAEMIRLFASSLHLPIVTYQEWLSKLEGGLLPSAPGAAQLGPAHRLMDFFRSAKPADFVYRSAMESNGLMCVMEMKEGLLASATLRDDRLPQLQADDIEKWLAYWRSVGLIA